MNVNAYDEATARVRQARTALASMLPETEQGQAHARAVHRLLEQALDELWLCRESELNTEVGP